MAQKNGNTKDPKAVAIGARLRTLREAKGMTKQELGAETGNSLRTINAFELGEYFIPAAKIPKLAEVLDADPVELSQFGDDGEADTLREKIAKLTEENQQLKKIVADQALEIALKSAKN